MGIIRVPHQNTKIIYVLGCCTRKNIFNKMTSFGVYSILVYETKDSSKKKQLSFVIRFVDNNFNIFEKALGCSCMKKSDANSLAQEIVKLIQENNLENNKCVAQCYDGASVMSGVYSGVQKKTGEIVLHTGYIHCYALKSLFG